MQKSMNLERRCRENMTHIRQSRSDSGPGFQVKALTIFEVVCSPLRILFLFHVSDRDPDALFSPNLLNSVVFLITTITSVFLVSPSHVSRYFTVTPSDGCMETYQSYLTQCIY